MGGMLSQVWFYKNALAHRGHQANKSFVASEIRMSGSSLALLTTVRWKE